MSDSADVLSGDTVDHVASAQARLLAQFQDKPNWTAILTALIAPVQDLESSAQQLLLLTSIDDSFGLQLDNIGAIIGEPRQGFDDTAYRLHLKARVFLNRSSGTPEDILGMFSVLTGAALELTEFFPAALELVVPEAALDVTLAPYFAKFLQQAKAAGVGAIFRWSPAVGTETFGFAGSDGQGFNDGEFSSAS